MTKCVFSLKFFDHALGSWNARFTELQFLDFSTVPTASLSSSSCETDQNSFKVSVNLSNIYSFGQLLTFQAVFQHHISQIFQATMEHRVLSSIDATGRACFFLAASRGSSSASLSPSPRKEKNG